MTAPSRYHQVLNHDRWKQAFGRQETIGQVLQYVLDHWGQLQKNPPADMKFSNSEPKITYFFGISLRKNAMSHGITGQFSPEVPVADINIRQELDSRGRTDISYFSDRSDPPLDFVLEFKKMKVKPGGDASRLAYCKSGVLRFVNAIYARETDFGFMVGLVDTGSNRPVVLNALKRAIQNPDMVQLLRTIRHPNGDAISTIGLRFDHCDFETRHARDHVPRQDVLVGHLLLVHEP